MFRALKISRLGRSACVPLERVTSKHVIHFQQVRHGVIADLFTNLLSFGFKTRGIKSRENFKPKGILVYKCTYRPYFRYATFGSLSFATVFTAITTYDFIYPLEYLAMNGIVMISAVITVWLLPAFVIPSFGRRFITRIWLENKWWVYIESHSRGGKLRHLRVGSFAFCTLYFTTNVFHTH